LRAAGVEVSAGLLAREAARLNEKYFHWHRADRPFVHLKLATTLDGRIATRTGDSRWITGERARARVQLLRHEADAILVGFGTAGTDDPLLTDRSDLARRRPLVRVVLDDRLRLAPQSRLAQTARQWPVIVFTSEEAAEESARALEECGVEVIRDEGGARDPVRVLKHLKRRELQSVLVEGGATAAGLFLDSGLVDKVSFFVAPVIVGGRDARAAVGGHGAARISEAARLRDVELTRHGEDFEITGYPERAKASD
jgi:diaminohydroxyphosphoribosylaminopyrimidine deaminase/5-amino-6-(5-phosphoribosylamino)uracil reductase